MSMKVKIFVLMSTICSHDGFPKSQWLVTFPWLSKPRIYFWMNFSLYIKEKQKYTWWETADVCPVRTSCLWLNTCVLADPLPLSRWPDVRTPIYSFEMYIITLFFLARISTKVLFPAWLSPRNMILISSFIPSLRSFRRTSTCANFPPYPRFSGGIITSAFNEDAMVQSDSTAN